MSADLMMRLKLLKLHGMAQCWPELMAKARHSDLEPEQWLDELIKAETAERDVRSLAYQMKGRSFRRIVIWRASRLPSPGWMRPWCAVSPAPTL